MAVKPLSGSMGALPNVGSASAGPAGLVDRIMEAESVPTIQARGRRDRVVQEKNDYASLGSVVGNLDKVATGIKTVAGFRKLAVESSHPDILEGVVSGLALPGSYEMEVRGLAQADKHLAFGFPDVDKSEIGFGHLAIELGDVTKEFTLDPGSTLRDAVTKINDAGAGVRAQIVNTGIADEPFRLLVTSEKTGEEATLLLDPDTTFLDFKNIKAAKNLDVRFEDVEVARPDNDLNDLVEGVKLRAKRAEPGTKVTLNVTHDIDKTMDSIKDLTETYNKVAKLAHDASTVDPASVPTEKSHASASDLRAMMRSMQSAVSGGGDMLSAPSGSKYKSLADIGITTNAKTGELVTDEAKLKSALADDYEHVSKIFAQSDSGDGIAGRISGALQRFRDPVHGVLASRTRGLDHVIKDQDKQIERQERRLEERRAALEHQFNAMQGRLQGLEAQSSFLDAQMGGAAQAPAAPKKEAG